MYNGIGLSTVRGSGTSGYVQRNLSHVPATKEKRKIDYKTEADLKKEEKNTRSQPRNIRSRKEAKNRSKMC